MYEDVHLMQGKIIDKTFVFPIKIYYEDTDAGGIVYYANYLKFAERARSECLHTLGINQQKILSEQKCGFVVRSCYAEYLASAVLEDELQITCQIKELGAASVIVEQKIYRYDELLATLELKLINMNIATHRPTRIDTEIRDKLVNLLM